MQLWPVFIKYNDVVEADVVCGRLCFFRKNITPEEKRGETFSTF